MTDQNTNFDFELAIAAKQAEEAKAQYEATQKLLQQLKEDRERRLNDPKELAKLLKNANDMIDAGIEDYRSKGYFCEVLHDENGIITKITIKSGKSAKSGTRGPKKKAGDPDFVPAMTKDNFAKIYSYLPANFNNKDIISQLVAHCGDGTYTTFKTQPVLGEILLAGHGEIKIAKVGNKGRNVSYNKIT